MFDALRTAGTLGIALQKTQSVSGKFNGSIRPRGKKKEATIPVFCASYTNDML